MTQRYLCNTKSEAEARADQQHVPWKNKGWAGMAIPERLHIQALNIHKRFAGESATITDAVYYYLSCLLFAFGAWVIIFLANYGNRWR